MTLLSEKHIDHQFNVQNQTLSLIYNRNSRLTNLLQTDLLSAIMSFSSCLASGTLVAHKLFRVGTHLPQINLQVCPFAIRTFTSSINLQQSSRRKLQTATTHRPQSLDFEPLPPRNPGIPDPLIAGGIPQINDTRPPDPGFNYGSIMQNHLGDRSILSMVKGEAQQSKPMESSTAGAPFPSPSSEKSKRSKLRPRKAAISLTPTAITHLRNLLAQPDPKMIRVGVRNRGCSGLAYHLEFVEKQGAFDECVEQDGVKVLIDSKALFSIIGSEMDWIEDKLNQRFVFRNPNISESYSVSS